MDFVEAVKHASGHRDRILDALSKFNRALVKLYQNEDKIISENYDFLDCKELVKEQLFLTRLLKSEDEFVVYATQKLLTQWLLITSNKEIVLDQFDVSEIQKRLLSNLYDIYSTSAKDKQRTCMRTLEAVLEIFHRVLKDFRQRLSLRDDDYGQNLRQHAGIQLLSLLDDQFTIEKIFLQMNSDFYYGIPVSSLVIFNDIKKLDRIIDTERDYDLADSVKSLSEKIDSNISHVIALLNHKYQPINRKVLNILHLVTESGKNVGVIIASLAGVLEYTQRIMTSPDRDHLKNLLEPAVDYTEFIFHEYYLDSCGLEFSLSLEIIKKLMNIYLSSFISLADILIKNEMACDHISTDNYCYVISEIISLCKVSLPSTDFVDYAFNWYINSDDDLVNFMNNIVKLMVRSKKLGG
ncbi:13770_t:CDS:2 [Acaulospora colombiana]|uniref:13770_t:CDS:1 n=1 Tax=Acaulospora colombiana TaxID=27376 RepID=A0ACA9LHW2_9GLOM|nr:13770_t:CDS:2 [Acaulospora colombiana]